jgi:hypothetical protein
MKLSWGYIITSGYLVFVAGIVFLVYKASSEKFDLVTKDYYEQELKYQEVIDESANTARLSAPLVVERSGNQLQIGFPAEMRSKKKTIDFYLYYPADAKRDFRKTIEIKDNELLQPLPSAMKGQYQLKLSWEVEGVKYYFEKKLFF